MGRAERALGLLYDHVPDLHDPLVAVAMPLLGGTNDAACRRDIAAALDLGAFPAGARVLDVGVGTGGNVDALASAGAACLWGVDVSVGMLGVLHRRLARRPARIPVGLALADAHALPFQDAAFDAIVHVGALNSFRDPAGALAEMNRVVRPGGRVVVVDEALDPSIPHPRWRRAAFRALTLYDADPHAPIEHLPPGVTDVTVVPMARIFYRLAFRRGA